MPWYTGNGSMMNQGFFGWGIIPLGIWSLVWTGLALWHAAERREKWWFILFLIVHTAGILEILYLLLVVKLFSTKPSGKKTRSSRKR